MQKPYVCNETRPHFTYVHNVSLTTVYRSKMVYRSEHALWTVSSNVSAGYDVGQSEGRPHGTTREAAYDVGQTLATVRVSSYPKPYGPPQPY